MVVNIHTSFILQAPSKTLHFMRIYVTWEHAATWKKCIYVYTYWNRGLHIYIYIYDCIFSGLLIISYADDEALFIQIKLIRYPIRNFLVKIQWLWWASLQCHIRFLWDSPTHYRGPMAGICRVYWGKLSTMRPTIYSCLWWDNPTSSPNNVGTSHALPRSFPSIYPGYNNGVSIKNPLLLLNKQIG